MAVINLDPVLGKTKNRISYVGIEVEGAWKKGPTSKLVKGDGSVFNESVPERFNSDTHVKGEIASDMLIPIEIRKWVTNHHPDIVNETCGLHVHMSFRRIDHYIRLMHIDYQDTLLEYIKRWGIKEKLTKGHPLWDRLEGKNKYCLRDFWPDYQVARDRAYDRTVKGHRYTVLNYCFRAHGTVECRVLPMFEEARQSAAAARLVVDVTNAYLLLMKKRNERVSSEVSIKEGPPIQEVYQIVI